MLWSLLALLFILSACPYALGKTSRRAQIRTSQFLKMAPPPPSENSVERLTNIYVRLDRWAIGMVLVALVVYELLLKTTVGEIPENIAVLTPSLTHGVFSFLIAAVAFSTVTAAYAGKQTLVETNKPKRKVARTRSISAKDYVSPLEMILPAILAVAVGVIAGITTLTSMVPAGSTVYVINLTNAAIAVLLAVVVAWMSSTLAGRPLRAGSQFDIFGLDLLRSHAIRALYWLWTAVTVVLLVVGLLFIGAFLPDKGAGGVLIVVAVFAGVALVSIYFGAASSSHLRMHFARRLWHPVPLD